MPVLEGGCHCGNIAVSFETAQPVEALTVRACQCSFCQKHGARTIRDPDGRATVQVKDGAALRRHRFGLATADFLICGRCGIYCAAVVRDGTHAFATLNANAFDVEGLRAPEPVSYETEDADARRARRARQWTPVSVIAAGG